MSELTTVLNALQGGSSAALIVSVYFIYKAEARLARIEKALEHYMSKDDGGRNN